MLWNEFLMPGQIVNFSLTMWNPAMLAGLAVPQVALSRYETLAAALRHGTSDGLKIKSSLFLIKFEWAMFNFRYLGTYVIKF